MKIKDATVTIEINTDGGVLTSKTVLDGLLLERCRGGEAAFFENEMKVPLGQVQRELEWKREETR